jgi:hypothetical protein
MRLGAGHRVGPFERTAELGAPSIVSALETLAPRRSRFEVPAGLLRSIGKT